MRSTSNNSTDLILIESYPSAWFDKQRKNKCIGVAKQNQNDQL